MTQKVGIFINSRSEYACLLSVIRAMVQTTCPIDPIVVLGGEFADADFSFYPDRIPSRIVRCHTLIKSHTATHAGMARSAAMMAIDTTTVVQREAFDKAIIVGDRYDTLGVAMTLAYMGVKIFHIQGGEESGNIDESIRHAITKLSHVHLVANNRAADNVRKLGEDPNHILVTGCPSLDLFGKETPGWPGLPEHNKAMLHVNTIGVGEYMQVTSPYIVVIYHPETFSKPQELGVFIEALASLKDHQKIILHPNAEPWSDHILKALKTAVLDGTLGAARLISYIEPDIFASVLSHASLLVGNSSAGIRQAGFIGLPVVNIGNRQANRYRSSNVKSVPVEWVRGAIEEHLLRSGDKKRTHDLYGDGHSAPRILEAVLKMNPPIQKRLCY
jgi:UDP-hydrolysing UDP-N-acetyl-D-glucosamine 2-epimerase